MKLSLTSRSSRVATITGWVAATTALTVNTIDGLTRRDGYSIVTHVISLSAWGDRAWLGTTAIATMCPSLMACGAGIAGDPCRTRRSRLVGVAVGVAGLAFALLAAFRIDPILGYPSRATLTSTTSGRLHDVGGGLLWLSVATACFAAARLRSHPRARLITRCSFALGLAAFFASAVFVAGATSGDWQKTPAGLLQRIALVALLAPVTVVSLQRRASPPGDHVTVTEGRHGVLR
jgi:hypothetical protein